MYHNYLTCQQQIFGVKKAVPAPYCARERPTAIESENFSWELGLGASRVRFRTVAGNLHKLLEEGIGDPFRIRRRHNGDTLGILRPRDILCMLHRELVALRDEHTGDGLVDHEI